jgi:hypothetical protein
MIVVSLDEDGHFQAARIDEREEVLFILKTISCGQFYEDLCFDNGLTEMESEDAYAMEREEWVDYLKKFEKKRQFEVLSI